MRKITNELRKKIALQMLNFIKLKVLNDDIGEIGKITEEEDRYVCYINQKLFNRCYKKQCGKMICRLKLNNAVFNGINSRIIEKFGLNKPIHYILENIDFGRAELEISTNASEVLFKNCTFRKDICVNSAQTLIFENNQYFCRAIFPSRPHVTITTFRATDVKYLKFINEKFINDVSDEEVLSNVGFGMKINADIVEFDNSTINCKHPSEFNTDKMIVEDSTINAPRVYIDSKSIVFNNSSLNVSEENGIIIQNESGDFVLGINPPIVERNNINGNFVEENQHDDVDPLCELRQGVIDNLHELLNYCKKIKEDKLKSLQDELEQQTIADFVKRK